MNENKYWLVKPEYYLNLNKILNSYYTYNVIKYFITIYTKGVYITYNGDRWGHMPYPYYEDMITSIKTSSKEWLENNNFEYKGEISRKSKLEKINKLNR